MDGLPLLIILIYKVNAERNRGNYTIAVLRALLPDT